MNLFIPVILLAIQSKSLLTGPADRVTPSSPQVTISRHGAAVDVSLAPGADEYPGITLTAPGKGWDLSKFGHIAATLKNNGGEPLTVNLRVDDDGDWKDSPWDTESVTLAPGDRGTVKVVFGYSYGLKPGHHLNSSSVPRLLLFSNKSSVARSFSIEAIEAGGSAGEQPPVLPQEVRIRPKGGILFGRDITAQVSASRVTTSFTPAGLVCDFQERDENRYVAIQPAQGRWDLRDYDGVSVRLKNVGTTSILPFLRLDSNGGSNVWSTLGAIDPNQSQTIWLAFAGLGPAKIGNSSTGSQITSDALSGIRLQINGPSKASLRIDEIVAGRQSNPVPSWLGKRPPIPGDWKKTLDDEFDGTKLNRKIWRDIGENYYDKVSHWSKESVIVGGGVARLRYSKKRGYQNDDPKRNETPYASGYLDTLGLWRQRYGYIEARMKIPNAPGLWPAFWMMPDRGENDPHRQDTSDGGMEFDIMENLTRWGTRRYNIAMHYDGYDKDHKAVGSDKIYVQPDKEGFLTCGLLWQPGLAVYYCNGQEVLRWENPRIANVPAILMFTLPSGGWDNDALDDRKLPADFVIDYVRAWQLKK